MARRRTRAARRVRRAGRRVSRGGRSFGRARGKIGGFFKKGMLGDTTSALGASVVTAAVADRTIPQYSTYAQAAAEYATGGIGGMIGAEVVKSVVGLPSILSNLGIGGLLGGGGQAQTVEAV